MASAPNRATCCFDMSQSRSGAAEPSSAVYLWRKASTNGHGQRVAQGGSRSCAVRNMPHSSDKFSPPTRNPLIKHRYFCSPEKTETGLRASIRRKWSQHSKFLFCNELVDIRLCPISNASLKSYAISASFSEVEPFSVRRLAGITFACLPELSRQQVPPFFDPWSRAVRANDQG